MGHRLRFVGHFLDQVAGLLLTYLELRSLDHPAEAVHLPGALPHRLSKSMFVRIPCLLGPKDASEQACNSGLWQMLRVERLRRPGDLPQRASLLSKGLVVLSSSALAGV